MLCRIAFNVSHRFVFPLIASGIMANCIDFTTCTPQNCLNLKINRVKAIFFRELVVFFAKDYLRFHLSK